MKTFLFPIRLIAILGMALLGGFALGAAEQDSSTSTAAPVVAEKTAPGPASTISLLPGAVEVLKLVRAHISDDIVVAFVKSSKTAYQLNANEIVYLREQGVSERVVAAMLDQPKPVAPTWAAPTAQQGNSTASPSYIAQPSTSYIQPAPAPAYVSSPPVYTYPAPAYSYYDSSPYYYGAYWGIPFPSLSFNFGFGRGFHGGGFHGGFRGHR